MHEEQKKDENKIIFKVDMRCEGCKEKVRKSLKGFPGLENIDINMEEQKVTVKGKVDAKKLLERMRKKCGKRTELLFAPLRKEEDEKKQDKIEERKEESPVVTIVLKVKMHCGGCAREVKRALEKIDGVCEVNVDMQGENVIVKGRNIEAQKLLDRLKKSGKYAEIVPPKKDEMKAEKKLDEKKDEKKEQKHEKKEEKQQDAKKEETQQDEKKEDKQQDAKKDETQQDEKKEEKQQDEKKEVNQQDEKKEDKQQDEQKEDKLQDEKKEDKLQDEKKDEKQGDEKIEEDKEHNNDEKNKEKTDGKEEKKEEKKPRKTKGEKKADDSKNDQIKKSENTPFKSVPEYVYPPQLFSDENPNACSIM